MKLQHPFISAVLVCALIFSVSRCSKEDKAAPLKAGILRGRILNEYGQWLTGAAITITGNGTERKIISTDGRYEFSTTTPGSYNFSIKMDGYIESTEKATINAGLSLEKDFILKAGTAFFRLVSDTTIISKASGAYFAIKVSSNTGWVVSSNNDWIIPERQSAKGSDSIRVSVSPTSLDTVRFGTVTVQSGDTIKQITVKQLPKATLKKIIPIPGNMITSVADSIALEFNMPVTVKSINSGYDLCQSPIAYKNQTANRVVFSYGCGTLGKDFPFTMVVTDSSGIETTIPFTVGFYSKAIKLTGGIQDYFVNDEDNSYWITTTNPSMLYKIDMETLEILHTYTLPNEPYMFTISPYNNKIYISYTGIPKLYIMSQDGATEDIIDIPHDTTRTMYEYSGPRIYPYKLCFTKNGKGIIWLSDNGFYTYYGTWLIDAVANHRIWFDTLPGDIGETYAEGKVNHDKTKIILTRVNDNPEIVTFDANLMRFSSYNPSKRTRGVFNVVNRKNNYVYSAQLYNQLVVDPETGFESGESFNDNRNVGNADFCYQDGKELTVYFSEDGYFEILNYATRSTPFVCDALYASSGTTATLDGKYVILKRHDGNYNSIVYQVPTAWFRY